MKLFASTHTQPGLLSKAVPEWEGLMAQRLLFSSQVRMKYIVRRTVYMKTYDEEQTEIDPIVFIVEAGAPFLLELSSLTNISEIECWNLTSHGADVYISEI